MVGNSSGLLCTSGCADAGVWGIVQKDGMDPGRGFDAGSVEYGFGHGPSAFISSVLKAEGRALFYADFPVILMGNYLV